MNIDQETVRKIAHLARMEFEGKEEQEIMKDLTKILDWVEKLNELETGDVKPLTNMTHEINVMREDEVREHLSHERGLKNAPKRDSDYFRVPKVLD